MANPSSIFYENFDSALGGEKTKANETKREITMSQRIKKVTSRIDNMFSGWVKSNRKYINQTFASLMASLTYFAGGETRSWSSSSTPSIQGLDGRNATLSQGKLPDEVASWITSAPPLGALAGAFFAGFILEKFGRRVTLNLSSLISLLAFIVLGLGKIYEIPEIMIICRLLTGVAVGLSMPAATIYISECTDPKIRGLLGSLPAVLMALGISFVYLLGTYMPWHILSYVCAIVPLLNIVGIMFTPESPYWLLSNNRVEEAEKAYSWFNGVTVPMHNMQPKQKENDPKTNSESEGEPTSEDQMCKDQAEETVKGEKVDGESKDDELSFFGSLKTKQVWHPFLLCILIMVFQQWSGINAVIFNTVTIFNAANVKMSQYLATNIVGAVQLIVTFLSILVVDRSGRRILLLISGIIMGITMFSMGAFFFMFNQNTEDPEVLALKDSLEWIPLVSLIVYMIGYSIGFASVPFLLIGELLPPKMKNHLGAIVSSFNLLMLFLVLKFFKTISGEIGYHGLFWIYGCVSVIGGIFGYVGIPETKGKSLKEIEAHFQGIKKAPAGSHSV